MANEWDKENAVKRGGRIETVSFDAFDAEERYRKSFADAVDPDLLYDLSWAFVVIERAFSVLRTRWCRNEDDVAFLERIKPHLPRPDIDAGSVAPLADELGMTPGALKTRISRFRDRLWGAARVEIAEICP